MRESVFAAGGVAMLAGTVQTLQADEAAGLVQQNKATRYGTGWAEDPDSLTPAQIAAVGALVSGAWSLATSGTWRPAAIGALPRLFASGGASGGTWALSYRNTAGTVTSDPAETVAAGATDVSPAYLDDATEIMVTITGTVTVEIK